MPWQSAMMALRPITAPDAERGLPGRESWFVGT
jgi:hypothetical protein